MVCVPEAGKMGEEDVCVRACVHVCVLSVQHLLFITSHIKIMIKLSLPVIEALACLSLSLSLVFLPFFSRTHLSSFPAVILSLFRRILHPPPPTVAFPPSFLLRFHDALLSHPSFLIYFFFNHHPTLSLTSSLCALTPQMERPGPAGGAAEPLRGARVPA